MASFTHEELVLLGRHPGAPLPIGGQSITGTVRSGNRSAHQWTYMFNPVFHATYGVTFFPGSLNLHLSEPANWQEPLRVEIGGRDWEFCPVVLESRAIGLAFRGNRLHPELLEVASPVCLRDRLENLEDDAMVSITLLPGTVLARPGA